MAVRLAEDGNDLIITYHTRKQEALAVVAEIEALGRKAAALQLDVGNILYLDEFVRKVRQTLEADWDTDGFHILVKQRRHRCDHSIRKGHRS